MLRVICFAVLLMPSLGLAQGKSREEKVQDDRTKVESEGFWIYNDLDKAFSQARLTGRPVLVVLRCIPCEECVKLDDDLIEQDPVIRPLLKEFVCVRQVSTNGLDLSLFQFDTDQSFAVFMLNADGTIYGRFGTRSHRTEWEQDVSLAGLTQALRGALELHAEYPRNKAALAAKRGPAPAFPTPESYPSLKDRYTSTLNYTGNVVQSCIHCHQIGDAERDRFRKSARPLPDAVLFPFPHPKELGLILDPREKASVIRVETESVAQQAGFRPGDRIRSLDGQPMLSIADVQWVLHHVPPTGGVVSAEVDRNGTGQRLMLRLPAGWRESGDLSWRVSSWGMRRMATGGLVLEELPQEERGRSGIGDGSMALRVKHVGQYGAHAAAKRAGFQQGDIIVSFDGRTNLLREADLFKHALQVRKPGERVPVVILRNGRQQRLQLPMQD